MIKKLSLPEDFENSRRHSATHLYSIEVNDPEVDSEEVSAVYNIIWDSDCIADDIEASCYEEAASLAYDEMVNDRKGDICNYTDNLFFRITDLTTGKRKVLSYSDII